MNRSISAYSVQSIPYTASVQQGLWFPFSEKLRKLLSKAGLARISACIFEQALRNPLDSSFPSKFFLKLEIISGSS